MVSAAVARALLTRAQFQSLARTRIRDARLLLRSGHYDGAYYLAGYAVECALKACIARGTRRYDFPDKAAVVASHTHDLAALVRAAGLERDLSHRSTVDRALAANWSVVKDWTEISRYTTHNRQEAEDLINSIGGAHGVLSWARRHW